MTEAEPLDSSELNAAEIDLALAGTPFAGKMQHFGEIDSTNSYALEEARLGALHGSFYVADEQHAGRGRSDHQWHSPSAEGLLVSVLLRPDLAAADLIWIPLLAGLAAHRAINEVTALTVDLRWPNDLLLGEGNSSRKVGGILVEAQTEQNRVTAVVIGIGINIHQRRFPTGLSTEPTSLDLETGRTNDRQELLIALLQSLDAEMATFGSERSRAATAIPGRIAAISTWVEGRRVEVHGPQPCTGVTAGLDDRGFLRVRTAGGLVTVTTGGIRAAID